MSNNWWREIDDSILACLRDGGAMSPIDLGRQLGISAREMTAFVCMLATQGKVNLSLVELAEGEPRRPAAPRARHGDFAGTAR